MLLAIVLICVLGTIILSLPVVQTSLAKYATDSINKEYNTNINIDRLRISLLSWDTSLRGVYVEDYKKDTLFYINDLKTSILSSVGNLVSGKLEFGDIEIDSLNFKLKTYYGAKDNNLGVFIDKLDSEKERDPNSSPFYLASDDVKIKTSVFRLIDENLQNQETLNFQNLNIHATEFKILGPEVTTQIEELSLKSKRGLSVDSLSTSFSYTKQQMRFDSLGIKTAKSNIKGNLVFDYNRKDFADFLNKVNVNAEFVDTEIALDEINLLYNQFGAGKKVVFSSRIQGVLNNLEVKDMFAFSDNTGIRGDFIFKELFNKQKAFSLKADMKNVTSNYYELRSLLPNIVGKSIPSSFQKLGQFTIRGDAYITQNSIDSRINLNTAIGSSYSDLKLTNINDIDKASYKGFVSLIDFDLGKFAENDKLGKTTLDFNVEGKGFVQKSLNTEVIGEVYTIDFNNYNYKDLKVSGILKNQLFDGSLLSKDENVKFNFEGLADFSTAQNTFNFIADVEYADLKKLNFINDSVSIFKGKVNMDITGNTLDNIVGDINFTQTNYQNKNDSYIFDDFKIAASFENDSTRIITINSPDIITGFMKGDFKVKELGKLVQNSVGSIYTNYKPFKISDGQRLNFNFKIYNKIVDVFYPQVKFGPNTFIKGNIVADEGDFKLNFKSPGISAYGNELNNIDIKIDNKNPLFNTFVSVSEVFTSYYDVQDFNLINTTLKDTLFFRTEFKGGSEYDDTYNLNFYHTFNNQNKSVIGLKTSDISFKDNVWVLNKEGNSKNKVIINRTLDSITIEDVVMNNNKEEQIRLKGQLADSTFKDLQLEFKIVSLDKVTPAIDSLRLGGEVNGTLNILQKNNIYLPTSNLDIVDFSVNDMRLGDLNIGIAGNRNLTDFIISTQLKDNNVEKLSINGNVTYINKKSTANLMADFNSFSLAPFSPLGEGVIENIRGFLSGTAQIKGDIFNPDISGLLTLDNAGIAIPYLNVDYDFAANSKVELLNQTFDFQQIRLTDVAMNTKATLDGTITHKAFKDWRLDLDVDTNDDRFLILNTAFDEDELYYGTGFLNGEGKIFGSTKGLTITVDGETGRGTSLKIPLSDVATVGDYSFINFYDKNEEKTEDANRTLNDVQGLELEFNLDITPEAEVAIIIDPKTGSTLKGTGEGLVLLRINTKDKFEMYGSFVVVTGEYNYKYGGLIDKNFTVEPGGTINWNGDPLDADLQMKAIYALNANPAPLLNSAGYSRRIPTEVVVGLNGQLERPEISWNIEFPGTNSVIKSELEYSLQDPTIEERNALFLLAQGTFVNEQTGINQQAVTGNIVQSGLGILNQVIGGGNDKLGIGLAYEQGIQDANTDIQTENRVGVTLTTKISDRVLVNGRLGVPVGGGVSETVVAGDVEVQILLNDEGTLSAKIFNRENEIQQFLADRQGYTQGVGISYEVDFNTFKELIRKIFRKKAPEEEKPKKQLPSSKAILGKNNLLPSS